MFALNRFSHRSEMEDAFSLFYLKHFLHLSPNSDIRCAMTVHLFEMLYKNTYWDTHKDLVNQSKVMVFKFYFLGISNIYIYRYRYQVLLIVTCV